METVVDVLALAELLWKLGVVKQKNVEAALCSWVIDTNTDTHSCAEITSPFDHPPIKYR